MTSAIDMEQLNQVTTPVTDNSNMSSEFYQYGRIGYVHKLF